MDLLTKLNNKIARLQYVSNLWQYDLRTTIYQFEAECNVTKFDRFNVDYQEDDNSLFFYVYITGINEDGFDSHTERIKFDYKEIKDNGFDSPFDFTCFLKDELNDCLKEDNKEDIPELFPGMKDMINDLTIRKQ